MVQTNCNWVKVERVCTMCGRYVKSVRPSEVNGGGWGKTPMNAERERGKKEKENDRRAQWDAAAAVGSNPLSSSPCLWLKQHRMTPPTWVFDLLIVRDSSEKKFSFLQCAWYLEGLWVSLRDTPMCHAKCWPVVTNHFSCRQRAVMVPQHVWSSGLLGTRASSCQCILVVRKKCADGFILMAVGRWTTRLAWMGAKKRSSDDASVVDRSSIQRPSQCDQSAPTVSMPEANARVSRAPESSRSGVIMSVEEKRKSRKRCRTCTIMSRKSLTSMLQSQHVCSLMAFMDAQQGASEGSCRTRDGGLSGGACQDKAWSSR